MVGGERPLIHRQTLRDVGDRGAAQQDAGIQHPLRARDDARRACRPVGVDALLKKFAGARTSARGVMRKSRLAQNENSGFGVEAYGDAIVTLVFGHFARAFVAEQDRRGADVGA